MNARFVLLNHFSQRYPKIPTFNEEHLHCAAVAFDLMSMTLKDFPILPVLYPALKAIFQEVAKDEEKEGEDEEGREAQGKDKKRKSSGGQTKRKKGETDSPGSNKPVEKKARTGGKVSDTTTTQ